MIAIGNVLLSDEIIEEHFVCDLNKCKGGCCVDGDCGAPLTKDETKIIKRIYPQIKSYFTPEYIYVTPTVNGGICVYGITNEMGIVKCGIEKAWKEGKTDFRKPISCHLFPIRIIENDGYEALNYEPRETLCKPACKLGSQLKVPVYLFLKEAITRKYGDEFYGAVEAVAQKIKSKKE
jgi:hypothetical protein